MNLNIRGSLGTQVMEYLCGLAQLAVDGKPFSSLSKITINTANTADHSKVDYISQIFDLDIPVVIADDSKKFGAFDLYHLENLIIHRKDILNYIKLQEYAGFDERKALIHYRNGDRQCLSDEYYKKLFAIAQSNTVEQIAIVGNDKDRTMQMFPKHISNIQQTPVLDWHTLRHANKVTGGFSAFTISAAILNTNKQTDFSIYVDRQNPVIGQKDRKALEFFDRVGIIRMKESHIDDL